MLKVIPNFGASRLITQELMRIPTKVPTKMVKAWLIPHARLADRPKIPALKPISPKPINEAIAGIKASGNT